MTSELHLWINYYVQKIGVLGLNGNKLKWRFGTHDNWKIKFLGAIRVCLSYQLNSTTNSAHLVNGLDWRGYLASKKLQNCAQDFDFLISMGADYAFELISIKTLARHFLDIIIYPCVVCLIHLNI